MTTDDGDLNLSYLKSSGFCDLMDHMSGGHRSLVMLDWFRTVHRGHVCLAAEMLSYMGCEYMGGKQTLEG